MIIVAPSKLKIRFLFSAVLFIIFSVLTIGTKYVIDKTALNASTENISHTIIIDAGHGGVDGGTSASDGTLEKDVNLQISHKLNNILQSFGIQTVMIRTEDVSIHDETAKTIRQKKVSDIKNRLNIINNTDNAIYVSIHQNHYSDSKYSGTQIFYSGNNPSSRKLAQNLRLPIITHLQKSNTREIKQSGKEIYLLNNAEVPAVMVECGFMSNVNENKLLKDESYQQKIAFLLAIGIMDYINSTEG